MIIKICGVTSAHDAHLCADSGADLIGVVLSDSPRRTSLEALNGIIDAVGSGGSVVGVFAAPGDLEQFDAGCQTELDYYQTYFDRSLVTVRQPKRAWIRAKRVKQNVELSAGSDITLLDFKDFQSDELLSELRKYYDKITDTTLVAGGLTVGNISSVLAAVRPLGVDVARGTEKSAGIKDPELVREFIARIKHAAS
ncbi:MAG: hypothetical protein AB1644_08780 [Candidatus Zixiibacteriota bacterium]